jgi:cardiolipin synthase
MLEAIEQSQHTIEFLTFVYWSGDIAERFAHALSDAAQRGVEVRVLLDAFGAKTMDRQLIHEMEDAGAKVVWFRPLKRLKFWKIDHRTHRKVMVCDGRVGFTGGGGIAEEWEGDARDKSEWRDTHFRITGPCLAGLRSAFLGNWIEADQPLPDDTTPDDQVHPGVGEEDEPEHPTDAQRGLVQVVRSTASVKWSDAYLIQRTLLRCARESIHLTTAYFVPHPDTVELLCATARRGVDIRILLPGPHTDERLCRLGAEDAYRPLLDAGVSIHVFQPTMLHAKVITVDGQLALLGSANFNQRSMQKDDEVCLTVLDPPLVKTLDQHFEHDLTRAEPVDLDTWRQRGWWQRCKETAMRVVRPEI